MKELILISCGIAMCFTIQAQTQFENAGFESWEAVTGGNEPVEWNSFLTASGGYNWAAAEQLEQMTDARPGSSGTSSARIWSRDTGLGVIANGNLTVGRINMGSTSPSDADNNYNSTITTDAAFSQAMTDVPDSIVFWAKYNNASAGDMCRVKATIHDNYDYHDPEGTGGSADHVVAIAELNMAPMAGWTRISVPFDYSVTTATNPAAYILVTFASNSTPGGGNADDEMYIDDVELIYNPVGIEEVSVSETTIFASKNYLHFSNSEELKGNYKVYSLTGELIQKGSVESKVSFNEKTGIYLVSVISKGEVTTKRVYVR